MGNGESQNINKDVFKEMIFTGDNAITINEEFLRNQFKLICNDTETINAGKLLNYLKLFYDSNVNLDKTRKFKYWDEKALDDWRKAREPKETGEVEIAKMIMGEISNPKKKNSKVEEIAKQDFNKNTNLTYSQFKNAFLLVFSYYDKNLKNLRYSFSSEIFFQVLVLRKKNIFERERIKNRRTKEKPYKSDLTIETSEKDKCDLPVEETERKTILKLVFMHLTVKDLLSTSSVSKEWLNVSRNDFLWSNILETDYYPKILEEDLIGEKEEKEEKFGRRSLKKITYEYLEQNKPTGQYSSFVEYWILREGLFQIEVDNFKPHPPMKCGIGALPRGEFVEDINGCCHDSVSEIAEDLFSQECVKELVCESEREQFKKDLSRQVGLECMLNKMDIVEIKERLLHLVKNRQI